MRHTLTRASADGREGELAKAEAQVSEEEKTLHDESARLAATTRQLLQRVEHMKARFAEATNLGLFHPQLSQRLAEVKVPELETLEQHRDRALAARAAALYAREQAAAALRLDLQDLKAMLSQISQQLGVDETLVKQLVTQAQALNVEPLHPTPPPQAMGEELYPAVPSPVKKVETRKQRAGPRVKMQAAIELSVNQQVSTGFSTNLSLGGLFVVTPNHFPVGTPVALSFKLPNQTDVAARAVVQWARGVDDETGKAPGVGLRFTALTDQARAAIEQFVSSREPLVTL